jgi:hypothetical protein
MGASIPSTTKSVPSAFAVDGNGMGHPVKPGDDGDILHIPTHP